MTNVCHRRKTASVALLADEHLSGRILQVRLRAWGRLSAVLWPPPLKLPPWETLRVVVVEVEAPLEVEKKAEAEARAEEEAVAKVAAVAETPVAPSPSPSLRRCRASAPGLPLTPQWTRPQIAVGQRRGLESPRWTCPSRGGGSSWSEIRPVSQH